MSAAPSASTPIASGMITLVFHCSALATSSTRSPSLGDHAAWPPLSSGAFESIAPGNATPTLIGSASLSADPMRCEYSAGVAPSGDPSVLAQLVVAEGFDPLPQIDGAGELGRGAQQPTLLRKREVLEQSLRAVELAHRAGRARRRRERLGRVDRDVAVLGLRRVPRPSTPPWSDRRPRSLPLRSPVMAWACLSRVTTARTTPPIRRRWDSTPTNSDALQPLSSTRSAAATATRSRTRWCERSAVRKATSSTPCWARCSRRTGRCPACPCCRARAGRNCR